MNYPIDPLEELSDQELEALAAYEHPLSDSSILSIQERFVAKTAAVTGSEVAVEAAPQRRSRKWVLLVAAVAAAFLLLVGFTNANRIYELYYQYFGAGADIAQYASEIGQSAVDQGFKMEVLSAVNDGEGTYLFVDLTDETGDRLSDDTFINQWNMTGSRPLGGGGTSLVGYDPTTKTATFMIHSISAKPGDSVLFTLNSFMSGANDYRVIADDISIAQLLAENEGRFVARDDSGGTSGGMSMKFDADGKSLSDIKETLELDAFALRLPGCDKAWISNIAYRDGELHVQLGLDRDRGNVAVWFALVNKNTGKQLDYYYSIGCGERSVDGLADHEEYVFEIDRNALEDYSLVIEGFYYTQVFDGTWEVGFEVPERMDSVVRQAGVTVEIGGQPVVVDTVEVSPLGVTLRMQDANQAKGDLDIVAVYKDGSTVSISDGEISIRYQGSDTYTIVKPLRDFDSIDHLIVNGTNIKL